MIPQYDSDGTVNAYRMKMNMDLFAHVGYSLGQEPTGILLFKLCSM